MGTNTWSNIILLIFLDLGGESQIKIKHFFTQYNSG
jgi:hypothetical protein